MHNSLNTLPTRFTDALSRRLNAAVHASVGDRSAGSSAPRLSGHGAAIGVCLTVATLPLAATPFTAVALPGFSILHLLAIISFAAFVAPAWLLSHTGSPKLAMRAALVATLIASACTTTAMPSSWLAALAATTTICAFVVMRDRLTWATAALMLVAYAIWAHVAFLGMPQITGAALGIAGLFAGTVMLAARFVWAAQPQAEDEASAPSIINTLQMNRSSRILTCTGSLCADLNISASPEPLLHRVHVSDRLAMLAALDRAAEIDVEEHLVCRLQTADNKWQPVRMTLLGNAAGTVDATIACDAEAALLREQVESLKSELETANGSKTRFIATMSHELRTPLNAILGFSDLLRQAVAGPVSERQEEYLNDIHGAGEHLLAIVNDILDASKIEAGYYQLACDDFEVTPVLAGACSLAEKSRNGSGVTVVSSIQPGLNTVFADQKAFKQIVINLLSNAVKFSHVGGEVKVALERRHKGVLLTIVDQGVGMNDHDLAAACQPFVQAESDHSRHAEGTGLGLAIVKGFVDLHGGRLEMISTPGKGTTVRVFLPNIDPSLAGDEHEAAEPVIVPIASPVNAMTPTMTTPLHAEAEVDIAEADLLTSRAQIFA